MEALTLSHFFLPKPLGNGNGGLGRKLHLVIRIDRYNDKTSGDMEGKDNRPINMGTYLRKT